MMKLDLASHQYQVSCWLRKNKYWLAYLTIVAILFFSFPLFNFSLTIDEEVASLFTGPNIGWIEQGRWGMYLLSYLILPNSVMPFVPLFITVICSALSYAIITRILSFKRTFADYVAAPLFIACPTLFYLYCFNTINYGIGIGFLLGAIAFYCFLKQGRLSSFAFVILASFVIGIYQAFLVWLVALFFLHLLSTIINRNATLTIKQFILINCRFWLLLILGIVVYFFVEQLFCVLFKIQISSYLEANFFNLNFSWQYWSYTFHSLLSYIGSYYLGDPSIYIYRLVSLASTTIISSVLILFLIFQGNKSWTIKFFGSIVFFLLVALPFVLVLINGGYMPTRTFISFPLVISGIVFLSWACRNKLLKLLIAILVIVSSFNFLVINNRLAFSNYLSWKSDISLTTRLLSRLDSLRVGLSTSMQDPSEVLPLEIIGYLNRPTSPMMFYKKWETIGESFYSHDEGNVYRVVDLMKNLGVYEYRAATIEERKSIMKKTLTMPAWPAYGSVAFVNGVAVIKFGNYSKPQLDVLQSAVKNK